MKGSFYYNFYKLIIKNYLLVKCILRMVGIEIVLLWEIHLIINNASFFFFNFFIYKYEYYLYLFF